MNFKFISDGELVSKTQSLMAEERRITLEVLHHLREIEARRLFLARGFGSLHEMCVRFFGYSEGAAYRRISAMRLLCDVPEAERAIESGALSLSSASTLQGFFRNEKKDQGRTYSKAQKLELIQKTQNQSRRECERMLAGISPQSVRRDSVRAVTETETEVRFTAPASLMKKLERIKGLAAHQIPDPSMAQLLEWMADQALKRLDPMEKEVGPMKKGICPSDVGTSALSNIPNKAGVTNPAPPARQNETRRSEKNHKLTRYIPEKTRIAVWKRDQGRCSYVDVRTGRRCASRHALQIDHIRPYALWGTGDPENLRLLCGAHNRWLGQRTFGQKGGIRKENVHRSA